MRSEADQVLACASNAWPFSAPPRAAFSAATTPCADSPRTRLFDRISRVLARHATVKRHPKNRKKKTSICPTGRKRRNVFFPPVFFCRPTLVDVLAARLGSGKTAFFVKKKSYAERERAREKIQRFYLRTTSTYITCVPFSRLWWHLGHVVVPDTRTLLPLPGAEAKGQSACHRRCSPPGLVAQNTAISDRTNNSTTVHPIALRWYPSFRCFNPRE